MAVATTDFFGFETGGFEVFSATNGSPAVTTGAARSGSGAYGLSMDRTGGNGDYVEYTLENSIADGSTGIIFSLNWQHPASPAAGHLALVEFRSSAGVIFSWGLDSSRALSILDNSSTQTKSSDDVWSIATYYRVDILFDLSSTGSCIVHNATSGSSSGTERINISSGDFSDGNALTHIRIFQRSSLNDGNKYDDGYFRTGATGVSDFLGDAKVKGHQGSDTVTATPDFENDGTTDTLIDLSAGTWDQACLTPKGGGSLEYEDDNQWGAIAFDGTNSNGQGPGPSGDSDYSGATIHAATFIWEVGRQAGGGADHFGLWGKWSGTGNASITKTADFDPSTGNDIKTAFTTSGNIPATTDYAVMGFEHSGGAGQDFICFEMWVEILYTAAGGATDDLDPYWVTFGQQQPVIGPPEIVGY